MLCHLLLWFHVDSQSWSLKACLNPLPVFHPCMSICVSFMDVWISAALSWTLSAVGMETAACCFWSLCYEFHTCCLECGLSSNTNILFFLVYVGIFSLRHSRFVGCVNTLLLLSFLPDDFTTSPHRPPFLLPPPPLPHYLTSSSSLIALYLGAMAA